MTNNNRSNRRAKRRQDTIEANNSFQFICAINPKLRSVSKEEERAKLEASKAVARKSVSLNISYTRHQRYTDTDVAMIKTKTEDEIRYDESVRVGRDRQAAVAEAKRKLGDFNMTVCSPHQMKTLELLTKMWWTGRHIFLAPEFFGAEAEAALTSFKKHYLREMKTAVCIRRLQVPVLLPAPAPLLPGPDPLPIHAGPLAECQQAVVGPVPRGRRRVKSAAAFRARGGGSFTPKPLSSLKASGAGPSANLPQTGTNVGIEGLPGPGPAPLLPLLPGPDPLPLPAGPPAQGDDKDKQAVVGLVSRGKRRDESAAAFRARGGGNVTPDSLSNLKASGAVPSANRVQTGTNVRINCLLGPAATCLSSAPAPDLPAGPGPAPQGNGQEMQPMTDAVMEPVPEAASEHEVEEVSDQSGAGAGPRASSQHH